MKGRKRRSVLQSARADGDEVRRPPGHLGPTTCRYPGMSFGNRTQNSRVAGQAQPPAQRGSGALLYFADVLWHARPAFCKAVVSVDLGCVMSWSWWCLVPGGVRPVGGVLAGRVGCVVEGEGCLLLSVRLVRSEEVRMVIVDELSSCGDGPGVKPERQVMSGAKSSVSGMGMEAHVVFAGFCRMDFRRCMLNSFARVVGFCVVVFRYFGEAIATSLKGGWEDGAGPVIIQTEAVGSFWRHGMSTGTQFRIRLWNCIIGVPLESSMLMTPSDPTGRRFGLPGSGVMIWTLSRALNGCGA